MVRHNKCRTFHFCVLFHCVCVFFVDEPALMCHRCKRTNEKRRKKNIFELLYIYILCDIETEINIDLCTQQATTTNISIETSRSVCRLWMDFFFVHQKNRLPQHARMAYDIQCKMYIHNTFLYAETCGKCLATPFIYCRLHILLYSVGFSIWSTGRFYANKSMNEWIQWKLHPSLPSMTIWQLRCQMPRHWHRHTFISSVQNEKKQNKHEEYRDVTIAMSPPLICSCKSGGYMKHGNTKFRNRQK